ncbi:orexin receptor type 2-like [Haliotis rufescens]|uniref:orexin receptor type 2-like n=1 Tax=Haliotis rufescens TaxID=6454 RepID=UPI00201FA780|nr:orexin receptor type 2-like [Haliotis rufescens]
MMDNTSFHDDHDAYLRDYDDRYAEQTLPVILFLTILTLVGFVGNSLVCYVYIVKFKPSPTNSYIIALAIFDFVNCSICIPHEIADMRYSYTFAQYGFCKVIRLVMGFVSYASGAIILTIAVDRYRKICRPFQRQATWLVAKVAITVCSVISLILASPIAAVFGERTLTTNDIHINGSDCSTADEYSVTVYPSIYNGTQFFLFVATTLCLVVLYSLIWRQIVRQGTFLNKFKAKQTIHSGQQIHTSIAAFSVQLDAPEGVCAVSVSDSKPPTDELTNQYQGGSDTEDGVCSSKRTSTVLDSSADARAARKLSTRSSSRKDKRPDKTLFILWLISFVFVLSFLPNLSLMAIRAVHKQMFVGIQGAGLIIYNLFLRSHFINSAINPIIYGFWNMYFRRELIFLWRKVTRRL